MSCVICRGGKRTKACGPIAEWQTMVLLSRRNTAPHHVDRNLCKNCYTKIYVTQTPATFRKGKSGNARHRMEEAEVKLQQMEATLKEERATRLKFELRLKEQLLGPQALVPVVFFSALKEHVVRRDSLSQYRESTESCLAALHQDHIAMGQELLWKEEQNRVSFGLLAVANGQLSLEQKKAAILAKRVETIKQKGASALAEVVSPLAAKLVAVEQELQWKELKGRVSSGLLAAAHAQLTVEKRKVAASEKRVESCKQKGARALAEAVSPLQTMLLAAEVDAQYHRQLSHVMSGAKASKEVELIAAKGQLAVEKYKAAEADKRAISTLLHIGEASMAAIESERKMRVTEGLAARKKLTTSQRQLEAAQNHLASERDQVTSLKAECAALVDEVTELECTEDGHSDSEFVVACGEKNSSDTKANTGLLGICGKNKERYCLDMIELGMELMSRGMTAPDARGVFIVVMKKAHPAAVLGVDYRVPDAKQFKRWRTWLDPLTHFMALTVLDRAKIVHLLHDGTTKKGISFFSVSARVTVNGVTQDIPVNFKVTADSKSETEAQAVLECLSSPIADLNDRLDCTGNSTLLKTVSSTSDGAANATKTSKLIGDAKKAAVDAVTALHGANSPELRSILQEYHVLHCSNHALNLLASSSHRREEREHKSCIACIRGIVWLQRIYRQKCTFNGGAFTSQQYHGLQPGRSHECVALNNVFTSTTLDEGATSTSWYTLTIGNTLWAVSKLFATHGGHSDYYLCEGLKYEHWRSGLGAEGDLLAAGALPSVKGSRQMITCELATFVILNRKGYLRYIRSVSGNKKLVEAKVLDANQLIKCAKAGLSNQLVVAGMLARALFFVCIGSLCRFVLNRLARRPTLRKVMDAVLCTMDDIMVMGNLHIEAHLALKTRILHLYPAWRQEIEAWELKTSHQQTALAIIREANNISNLPWVRRFWLASLPDMKASWHRNIDADLSEFECLADAPWNTDCVEGNMGTMDFVRHRCQADIPNCFGVAQATRMQLFSTAEQAIDKQRQRMKKKNKSDWTEVQDCHTLTRWYSWPQAERTAVLRIISRNSGAVRLRRVSDIVLQQATTMAAHDSQRTLYLTKTLASLLEYRYWLKCKVYTSKDIKDLLEHVKTVHTIAEQRRFISDQIRLRQCCYGLPKRSKKHPNNPLVSCGKGLDGLERYIAEVAGFIAGEGSLILCVKRPGSNLDKGDQQLDVVARMVEDEYNVNMDKLRDEWFEKHPDGAFRAYRQTEPQDLRPRTRTTPGARKRKRPELQPGHMAEVNGTTYVVFNIFAHPSSGNLVVAYYEADAVDHLEDANFETLRALDSTHEQDLYLRAGEYVSVADYQEVMDWVLNSEDVNPRYHIPGLSPTLRGDLPNVTASSRKLKLDIAPNPNKKVAAEQRSIPGFQLIGELFIDPPTPLEPSLGLCFICPRPKGCSMRTTFTFYKPARYHGNKRKVCEQTKTTEVVGWVIDSKTRVLSAINVIFQSGHFAYTTAGAMRSWKATCFKPEGGLAS